MPNPTRGDIHVDRVLTNISIAYMQASTNFVARRLFPTVPSSKQQDLYRVWDRGAWNTDQAKARARGTETAGGGYRSSTEPFNCTVYGFHDDIDDQDRGNEDEDIELERTSTEFVTMKMMLRDEAAFIDAAWKTGVWTTDVAGVASSPTGDQVIRWSDYSASDPIRDVKAYATAMQLATGFRPNVLGVGRTVWDKLADHPDLVDRVKYGQTSGGPAQVTRQSVAALFEVDEIVCLEAIINNATPTTAATQPETNAFLAGNNALLLHRPRSPGKRTPAAGYTFTWTGYLGASAQSNGGRIKKFRMEHIASDRIEGEIAMDPKIISPDLGTFFSGIVA